MPKTDFTLSFTVDQSPAEAFRAIQDVTAWWSRAIEGGASAPGDVFTYRFQDLHYSRQELVELVPGERVTWLVLDDARLSFTEDRGEWRGTKLRFDVARVGGRTEVRFTHVGLSKERECFDACSRAWTFYVTESLRGLIASGQGQPDPATSSSASPPAR